MSQTMLLKVNAFGSHPTTCPMPGSRSQELFTSSETTPPKTASRLRSMRRRGDPSKRAYTRAAGEATACLWAVTSPQSHLTESQNLQTGNSLKS